MVTNRIDLVYRRPCFTSVTPEVISLYAICCGNVIVSKVNWWKSFDVDVYGRVLLGKASLGVEGEESKLIVCVCFLVKKKRFFRTIIQRKKLVNKYCSRKMNKHIQK